MDRSSNSLAEREKALQMEVVGRLAGRVAHDFNNLLTAMMLNLEEVRSDPLLPTKYKERIGDVVTLTEQGARLTRQLLEFSRQQPMNLEPLAVNLWLSHLTTMIRGIVIDPISLTTTAENCEIWVLADTVMLDQVMMNLIVNACDAMPKGGILRISAKTVHITEEVLPDHKGGSVGHFACVSISDSGIGMDEETLKNAFEPFFTAKENRKGSGLGLASSQGIVLQHSGWIEAESQLNVGSEFRVYLPLTDRRPNIQTSPSITPEQGATATILVVEDQPVLRKLVTKLLTKLGYEILTACDGVEALEVWEAHHERIGLLISDVMMPNGISGFDLQKGFREKKPGLKVILMSGFSSVVIDEILADEILFLPKPFSTEQLSALVRDCFPLEAT